jgi:hypothetical protein
MAKAVHEPPGVMPLGGARTGGVAAPPPCPASDIENRNEPGRPQYSRIAEFVAGIRQ